MIAPVIVCAPDMEPGLDAEPYGKFYRYGR